MSDKAAAKSQSDKFKEAAREHEADEDEKRCEERLKKVAKPIPLALPRKLLKDKPSKPDRP
jgi:hypothetical protein